MACGWPGVGSKNLSTLPLDIGKENQTRPSLDLLELMAAALKWNILELGLGTNYSPTAAWLQPSDLQIIFQVATFGAYHLSI